jgi:hypothetical protein
METAAKKAAQSHTVLIAAAIFAAAGGGVLFGNGSTIAKEEARDIVRYDPLDGRFIVSVHEARVSEIILTMSRKSGLQVVGRPSAIRFRASGTFEGSVHEIFRRLLRGRGVNYKLVSEADRGKRLIILNGQDFSRPFADPSFRARAMPASHLRTRSAIELLRQKERELVAQGVHYKEMSKKARANTEVARRMADYAERLLQQARAIRTRIDRSH